jgi:hypothetical protein
MGLALGVKNFERALFQDAGEVIDEQPVHGSAALSVCPIDGVGLNGIVVSFDRHRNGNPDFGVISSG